MFKIDIKRQLNLMAVIPLWGWMLIGLAAAWFLYTLIGGALGIGSTAFVNATLSACGGNTSCNGYVIAQSGQNAMITSASQNSNIATLAAVGVLIVAIFNSFAYVLGMRGGAGGRL